MDIRQYVASDQESCLAIFDSNSTSFTAGDRARFEAFLRQPGPYYVMEHEGAAIGCGGYVLGPQTGTATLVWGMIRRDAQKLGLGRFLLMFRLREIGKLEGVERVMASSPREAAKFYERQGFKIAASGEYLVEMVKRLAVCA